MTINQILDEQKNKIEEYISIYPDGEESFEEVDIEPEQFRSLFNSFSRKLIESVAEELIGKDTDHVPGTLHNVPMRLEEVEHGSEVCYFCRNLNLYRAEQRLKVKEIITNLK